MAYWLHRALALLSVVVFHFWLPTNALNALAPLDAIKLVQSQPYGEGARRTLDLYLPRSVDSPAPVVVFFYGGGWSEGSKDWFRSVGAGMAALGVIVVIPDYRLYPDVRFPDFMYDAAAAAAWVRANVARYGGDPKRLFLMGHSAGAQIAALLALDPRYLGSVEVSQRDVCGMIGLAGPYDYIPEYPLRYQQIFGSPKEWSRASPINFVSSGAPPMLLLSGTADRSVEPGNTLRLADRLRGAGVPVTVAMYPGINHEGLLAALSTTLGFLAPAREDVLRFIAARGACGG